MKSEKKLNRREFAKSLGGVAISAGGIAALSSFLSCSNDSNPASPGSTPTSGSKLEIDLNQTPELQQVGGYKAFSLDSTPIMVFRTQADTFLAVSRVCTHQGCTINWVDSGKKFACPCHGSQFAQNGSVLKGPAVSKLQVYSTQFDSQNNMLTISA